VAQEPKQSQKKRLVKNPETFRERALKATEASDKPKRSVKLKQTSGKVTRPLTSPVGRAFKFISAIAGKSCA
jgi:hypothetical protein